MHLGIFIISLLEMYSMKHNVNVDCDLNLDPVDISATIH